MNEETAKTNEPTPDDQKPAGDKKRFYLSLHGLRGAAAFMVFFGHSAGGFNEHYQNNESAILSWMMNFGTFGVELFFVLSGFVICKSIAKNNWRKFLHLRFWRIYPVFLFFTFLFFSLNLVLNLAPERNSLYFLVCNLLQINILVGTQAITPNAWSITYEIWFYILAFVSLRPLFTNNSRWISALGFIASAVFLIVFPISVYFIGGLIVSILMDRYRTQFESINRWGIWAAEFVVVGAIVYFAAKQDYLYEWKEFVSNWNLVVVYVLTLSLIVLLLHPKSFSAKVLEFNWLLWLGTISYSLYLAHPFPYGVSRRLLNYAGIAKLDPTFGFIIYLVSATILVIPVTYVVYRFVEVLPYEWATGRSIYSVSKKPKSTS